MSSLDIREKVRLLPHQPGVRYPDGRTTRGASVAALAVEGGEVTEWDMSLLAQAQLEKGNLEEALATANTCVGADPNQSFCWITIATVEQANENLPRALEAYRKYLEVEPDGRHAKSAKKQVARLEGKVEG